VIGEGERDSKNGPSWFNAPLKVSVKDAEGRPVETRKIRLKVKLPTGIQKVSFNHVESDVSLPPPPPGGYRDWMVVVGFDPAGQPAKKEASKAVRKAAVKRAVRTARAAPPPAPPLPPSAGVGTAGAAPVPAVTTRAAPSGDTNFTRLAKAAAERKTQAQAAQAQRQPTGQAAQRQPALQRPQAAVAQPAAQQRRQAAVAQPAPAARQQVAVRPAPVRTAQSN